MGDVMALLALVVDDAPANRDFAERLLTGAQFEVRGAASGERALEAIESITALDLALVDWKLPDMTGLDLLGNLRERFPESCLVIATMYDDRTRMDQAFEAGCNIFLVKPHGFMELFRRLTAGELHAMRSGPPTIIDQYGPRPYKRATALLKIVEPSTESQATDAASPSTPVPGNHPEPPPSENP
jgi:CheY-like chemotaxis protein